MIVYSISSLLILSEKIKKDSISLPFLESFVGKYSQKVNEDRKTPLFSKTTKYNNFPVRCKWKNKKNAWRHSEKIKLKVTKFNKQSGIKRLAIKVLNKITIKNYEIQSNELLKVLIQNKEQKSVKIIAELILDKIWYDKGFYNLYVNLCKKLWNNNDWITECYTINNVENSYSYTLNFESINKDKNINNTFKTIEKATQKAIEVSNFKTVFLSLCRDNFYKRKQFIEKANETQDSTIKYKIKRRLFGTVEILGYFYNLNELDENIIHFIFLSLLHTDSNNSNGASYPEEIEAFKLLWDISYKNINKNTLNQYRKILKKEFTKDWGSRINFMIEDMIENISNKDNVIKKSIVSQWCKKNISILNKENKENIFNKIIKLSRNYKKEFSVKQKDLLEYFNKIKKDKNTLFSKLIIDCTEYSEHINNHYKTIIYLLNNSSNTSLNHPLSDAFTISGKYISDLKIDAPKAPQNMGNLIIKIINNTNYGSIVVKYNCKETQKEWENIYNLINTEIKRNRFIIRKI